jgi:hypothetical protein
LWVFEKEIIKDKQLAKKAVICVEASLGSVFSGCSYHDLCRKGGVRNHNGGLNFYI